MTKTVTKTKLALWHKTKTRPLTTSWRKAAGLLRGKEKAPNQHVERTRGEWR